MTQRTLTVAAIQTVLRRTTCAANIAKTEGCVREAAGQGAQVILPPELFQGPYFCVAQEERWFADRPSLARASLRHRACARWPRSSAWCIPISFFEREGPHYFNSLVMVDADGAMLGVYRKSHIPDGPGYQEKYYFRPGDTGFKVWKTQLGAHRRRHLLGPVVPGGRARHGADGRGGPALSHRHRLGAARPRRSTRAARGGARCRATPSPTSSRWSRANRIGTEDNDGGGQSYLRLILHRRPSRRPGRELRRKDEGVLLASFDLDFLAAHRAAWGFFRDRRPDLYAKSIL